MNEPKNEPKNETANEPKNEPRSEPRNHVMNEADPYPPFITERSPSYERARRELEHPSPTTDPEVIAALNRLVEAEDDAVAILDAAAERARDPGLRVELEAMRARHQAALGAIEAGVATLGGAAPAPGERAAALTCQAGDMAYLQSDHELVAAIAAAGEELAARYDEALERLPLPEPARQVLADNIAGLRREQARLVALERQGTANQIT